MSSGLLETEENITACVSIDASGQGAYRERTETSVYFFMNAITTLFRAKRIGAVTIIAMLALLILGGNQRQVYADLYPFNDPPSGTDVLCYINGLDEVNGVTIIHPPVPGFNVGECGDTPGGDEDPDPTPNPACSNNEDDDGDGFTDENDPNCHTDGDPTNSASYNPNKTSEAGSLPVCWNGSDDDEDGKTDFPNDPGCSSATDTSEEDEGGDGDEDNGGGSTPAQCSNGTDDDGDNLVDSADSGCHTDFDAGNSDSYDPNGTNEAATAPQCSDGIDNDSDGVIDSADSSCHTDFDADNPGSYDPQGNDESASAHIPQCSDGIDNDSDGVTDLADGGCANNADDDDESNNNPSEGGGGGGGGGSSRSSTPAPAVLGAATTTPLYSLEEIAACDTYLTAFIKIGQDNDVEQVMRLQRFLNDFEGASLEVNGFYGTTTLAAVHAFQTKYAADILTPWGIGESTGFVYLTTRKKVNEIFCNNTKSFPLTEEQQRLVNEARARASLEATTPRAPIAPQVPGSPAQPTQVVSPTVPNNASTTGQAESALKNVFEFVRGWFGSTQEE